MKNPILYPVSFLCLFSTLLLAIKGFPVDCDFIEDQCSQDLFDRFKMRFGKTYENSEEEAMRFVTFRENLGRVAEINARAKTAQFGVTKFSDMDPSEFKRTMLTTQLTPEVPSSFRPASLSSQQPPWDFDWREHNAITPVKDQKSCGGCYAFASAAGFESQLAIKGHGMVDISEDELISCDAANPDQCGGGATSHCFEYLQEKGYHLESDYPYNDQPHSGRECRASSTSKKESHIEDILYFDGEKNETILRNFMVERGPFVIASYRMPDSAQFYLSGVFDDNDECGGEDSYHSVQAVGYGQEALGCIGDSCIELHPFWIAKNSWADTWGDKGFFKFPRGTNHCGCVNEAPRLPILSE